MADFSVEIYIQGEKTNLAASDVDIVSGETYVCPRSRTEDSRTTEKPLRNPKMSFSGIRPIDQQAGPRKEQGKLLLYPCHHPQRRPKTTGTSGSACDSRTPRPGVTKERGRGINAALPILYHTHMAQKKAQTRTRHEKRKSGKFENSDDPTLRLSHRRNTLL